MKKNYKILVKIGSGGMADIYKALQVSLDRIVVVKQVKEKYLTDPTIVERFIREAKMAASFHHQNIAHIYDFWQDHGSVAMAMEYVDGMNLYQILKNVSRFPETIVYHVAYMTARAISYANRKGIIHRDLKPANIMITKSGEIKLMDFGIAKMKHEVSLTMPGIYLGTPSYMSPEQVVGRELTPESDVWSFGTVLYELLTGRKAFADGETKTVFEMIQRGRYKKPRSLNPRISYRMQSIIRKCLRVDPRDRYPNFAMIEELFGQLKQGYSEPTLARFIRDHFSYDSIESGKAGTEVSVHDEDIIHTQTYVPQPGLWEGRGALGLSLFIVLAFLFSVFTLGLFQLIRL